MEIASKGEFATICKVSAARVSQWLAQGHISGPAIVGEGRNARIRVAVAQTQLRNRRDVGQALSNGLHTNLDAPPPAQADLLMPKQAPKGEGLDVALREAKLFEIHARNRETAEKEAARRGIYVDATASRREMAKVAGAMLALFEGGLTDMASAIQSRFGVEHRDVLHLLREQFRTLRTKAATDLADKAAALPELIEGQE